MSCAIGFNFKFHSWLGKVISAELVVDTGGVVFLQPSDAVTYSITSLLNEFEYDDLGTGIAYGSRLYQVDDKNHIRSMVLSQDAIAGITAAQNGVFGVSGRLSDGVTLGVNQLDHAIFGDTGGLRTTTQLQITTIPEPTTLSLLAMICVSLSIARNRLGLG